MIAAFVDPEEELEYLAVAVVGTYRDTRQFGDIHWWSDLCDFINYVPRGMLVEKPFEEFIRLFEEELQLYGPLEPHFNYQ